MSDLAESQVLESRAVLIEGDHGLALNYIIYGKAFQKQKCFFWPPHMHYTKRNA